MNNIILIIVAAAFIAVLSFFGSPDRNGKLGKPGADARNAGLSMTCKTENEVYTAEPLWRINSKKMTVAYFDTHHYNMRYDCRFFFQRKEIKPVHSANGLLAFEKLPGKIHTSREWTQYERESLQIMESNIGFPTFRPFSGEYVPDSSIALNVSSTHYIMPEYAFNAVLFPKAARENAVNVCREGWVYHSEATAQKKSDICIPRGKEYQRLYSLVTNENGAQMLLYCGTTGNPKYTQKGWVLVNEKGEFMGFVK